MPDDLPSGSNGASVRDRPQGRLPLISDALRATPQAKNRENSRRKKSAEM
jgi:hypothetical protein